ncbi:hypothetical protein [Pelagerythrobacter marensis]|uniref:Uncharacterized protein n=1 Tax=Pelagerythrobacter marensis TaxID=543877 RepID=A0A0G3XAK9_9SPHN|nr:hypothetical protein [Pelagerythrobacter marensis]AKM08237.1 hypothetical protein AM2010_2177 [Pelagerythrobacter marensis]
MDIRSPIMTLVAQADPWIVGIAAEWIGWKMWLSDWTALSHPVLHAYLGLLAQILFAAVARRGLASVWPWLLVLLLECGNELLDWSRALAYGTTGKALAVETAWDIAFTMALPTALLILARCFPRLNGEASPLAATATDV